MITRALAGRQAQVSALVILVVMSTVASAQAPDAPQPQPSAKHVTFWTFRKSPDDPPLRSNREVFKAKWFIGGAAVDFAAMSIACRNPRSEEQWHSEVPAVIAVQGIKYLAMRFFAEFYVPPIDAYVTQHYIRAAVK